MDDPNPWSNRLHEYGGNISINLIAIWNWICGRKRKKFREWLADNRKRRRQALHFKEPKITEVELHDKMD